MSIEIRKGVAVRSTMTLDDVIYVAGTIDNRYNFTYCSDFPFSTSGTFTIVLSVTDIDTGETSIVGFGNDVKTFIKFDGIVKIENASDHALASVTIGKSTLTFGYNKDGTTFFSVNSGSIFDRHDYERKFEYVNIDEGESIVDHILLTYHEDVTYIDPSSLADIENYFLTGVSEGDWH